MGKSYVQLKKYPTIAVCGLDCGLCPRFYTVGKSRCPGCAGPNFFAKHPSCSFITCCVKKNNLEVCAECSTFPCSKFKSNEEYQKLKESSSFPSSKKIMSNLIFIKDHGIEKFMEQQKVRMKLLKTMIEKFDDGRSRSYFCKASTLIDSRILKSSIDKAILKIRVDKINQDDVKSKAKILKTILDKYLIGVLTN
ncbi:MAG: DUF3795 domain-containing protein [Ignavibacteriales bacterium]|nr:DUF3795 domain-containing protein [Ignavibacteriales bacterium]